MAESKEKCPEKEHVYECTYEGWEKETYTCKVCGDRYSLYDDEMK